MGEQKTMRVGFLRVIAILAVPGQAPESTMVNTTELPVYDSAAPRRVYVDVWKNLGANASLIKLLVVRDLTLRYKRSVLGVWWTLLNPILTTAVMWIVFSQIFSRQGDPSVPFVVYLLSGVLLISMYFSQGVLASGSSLVASHGLLEKMPIPPEVFAFTAALAAMANFAIGLFPLLFIQVVTGVGIPWTILLVPIPTFAMLLLITGLGLLIASMAVHFFDVLDFVRVLLQLTIWLVPTFYPLSMVPDAFQIFIKLNPLYSYLVVFRGFVYAGEFAPVWNFVYMGLSAVVGLFFGVWVFSKSMRNLTAYL